MNLISCSNCGVVLDKNKIDFPDVYDNHGTVILGEAEWDGDKFVSSISCPVCKKKILETW